MDMNCSLSEVILKTEMMTLSSDYLNSKSLNYLNSKSLSYSNSKKSYLSYLNSMSLNYLNSIHSKTSFFSQTHVKGEWTSLRKQRAVHRLYEVGLRAVQY